MLDLNRGQDKRREGSKCVWKETFGLREEGRTGDFVANVPNARASPVDVSMWRTQVLSRTTPTLGTESQP